MKRLIIIGCLFALVACGGGRPQELVLFDFESDAELDLFQWKCHTLFSLSNQHVTLGKRSLKLELYPSEYPGLQPMLGKIDWQGYEALHFDLYNPQKEIIQLTVRIDDREDYPKYGDRYNKALDLKPGMNRVTIPLDSLVTSGTGRQLDLRKIHRVMIFSTRPERKVVLYVDNIRLI